MIEHQAQAAELDPDIERFALAVQEAYARHGMNSETPVQRAREIAERVRAPWAVGGPAMASSVDLQVPVEPGEVRIRVHTPHQVDLGGALIYLHGGGWALFSLDTHDRLMREYASRARLCVIGVEYSLAPEAKFPRAVEETCAVVRWLGANGAALGVDPERLAIGGDSAGANLSVAACLVLRDEGYRPLPGGLLLNYGAFDAGVAGLADGLPTPPGFTLTYEEMKGFWRNYVNSPEEVDHPLVNLLRADLGGMPPALLVVAECDTLCAENLEMARRFRAAGVPARCEVYAGATHSFLEAVSIAAVASRALDDSAAWLRETLA